MAASRLWKYIAYDLVATHGCHIFGFPQKPELDTKPLALKGGVLYAGELIKTIKGPHASAGFFQLEMLDGHALRYEGTHTDLQGTIVCFSEVSAGQTKDITNSRWQAAYFGYYLFSDGDLCFTTPSWAGRVVETDVIIKVQKEEALAVTSYPTKGH